jgi:hypothetical protein
LTQNGFIRKFRPKRFHIIGSRATRIPAKRTDAHGFPRFHDPASHRPVNRGHGFDRQPLLSASEPIYYEPLSPTLPSAATDFPVMSTSPLRQHVYDHLVSISAASFLGILELCSNSMQKFIKKTLVLNIHMYGTKWKKSLTVK